MERLSKEARQLDPNLVTGIKICKLSSEVTSLWVYLSLSPNNIILLSKLSKLIVFCPVPKLCEVLPEPTFWRHI